MMVCDPRLQKTELGAFICFLSVEAVWSCCEQPHYAYCSAFPIMVDIPSSLTLLLVLHFRTTKSKITNARDRDVLSSKNKKLKSLYQLQLK